MGKVMQWVRNADKRFSRSSDRQRQILVNARTSMNAAVVAPIYNVLRNDPRITFFFTASEQPANARGIYGELNGGLKFISPRRAMLMRFDSYIVADVLWMTLPRGAPRILMFHGVAGKYSNIYDRPDSSMRAWDRLFFINRRRMRNFIASGAISENSSAARLVGYPKIDCLVDGSLQRDDVLSYIGIDPNKRTVLYAPTWSQYSSLNSIGEQLVQSLCDAGYAVVVKLHDRSRDSRYIHSGGIDWVNRLEPVLKKSGGRLAASGDACKYMAAADVMITDHSSAGFEYLLLDRPLIRIEMPELIARTNIPNEYVQMMVQASTTVRTPLEAVNAVDQSMNCPRMLSDERRSVAEELFYDPGNATVHAVRELYELIELDPLPRGHQINGSIYDPRAPLSCNHS